MDKTQMGILCLIASNTSDNVYFKTAWAIMSIVFFVLYGVELYKNSRKQDKTKKDESRIHGNRTGDNVSTGEDTGVH